MSDAEDLWVVLGGEADPAVLDEAHRVADLLAESGDRPSVSAVVPAGVAGEDAVEAVAPDEVIRLEPANGEAFPRGAAGVSARVGALSWLADERPPLAVLTHSTPDGDDLVARLARRLRGGCVTDCLVRVRDGELLAGRVVYEGRAYAEFDFETGPPVVSVNADALGTPDGRPGGPPETSTYEVPATDDGDDGAVRHVASLEVPESDLSRASVIVAGGQGLGGPEGFETVRDLADAVGGALGASRPPADEGWVPYDRQIGVTGKEIDADLYVPVAISGDPYHMRSVAAEHLVPINVDPDARIFEFADLGVVGDAFEYAPAIADAIRTAREREADAGEPGDVEADGGTPGADGPPADRSTDRGSDGGRGEGAPGDGIGEDELDDDVDDRGSDEGTGEGEER